MPKRPANRTAPPKDDGRPGGHYGRQPKIPNYGGRPGAKIPGTAPIRTGGRSPYDGTPAKAKDPNRRYR